ncbi:BPSL0761 family protein [Paraburkholderia youngii]|uniref:BPSL0761 family protein n=1 Tax=Paraburkholderia youngii TaxID=2782701 RepID=UPI00288AC3C3|nr:BPSL0761 family protein [Paraburkholderia youngii]
MTTPDERTRAVMEARWFLQTLAEAREPIDVPGLVRSVAENLLRHYPRDGDIAVSASVLPELWGDPSRRTRQLRLVRGSRD